MQKKIQYEVVHSPHANTTHLPKKQLDMSTLHVLYTNMK